MKVTKHFDIKEMRCKCGCGRIIATDEAIETMLLADYARDLYGFPLSANSWNRCPEHNASKKVGGKPESKHLLGLAVDLAPINHFDDRDLENLKTCMVKAGFNYIEVHKKKGTKKGFIHGDTRDCKLSVKYI